MDKFIRIKSDYSTDPDGTALSFEIAARDRDVDIALKELQFALKAGEEIARDGNASLSVIIDTRQRHHGRQA